MSVSFRSTSAVRSACGLVLAATALASTPAWAQTKLASADQNMLKDIAQANIAEIESGKVAVEKSQNEDVKKFAQMMVDDHSKALMDVQKLAESKSVTLPTDPDVKHKATMLEFKALSGKTFDSRYVKQAGVGDHEATDKLLKKTQANAKDADLKALAGKMIPVVEGHLQHARDLAKMKG
jgi:putative membrane protein